MVSDASAKPSAATFNIYSPGSRGRENSPFASVIVADSGWALPDAVIFTFAIAARLGSSTRPRSWDRTATSLAWMVQKAPAMRNSQESRNTRRLTGFLPIFADIHADGQSRTGAGTRPDLTVC